MSNNENTRSKRPLLASNGWDGRTRVDPHTGDPIPDRPPPGYKKPSDEEPEVHYVYSSSDDEGNENQQVGISVARKRSNSENEDLNQASAVKRIKNAEDVGGG